MFFTGCLVTKIKNWQGPQIDRFLITLCTKKYIFFPTAKGPPHEWWRSMGNGLDWASADSIHFGKLDFKRERICMEINWKSEEIVWNCEGFIEKMKKRIWKKWRIWLKRKTNLYGKESVWQNMVNWRICIETCRIVIGKWRIYMEKSWICLETWKKLYGKKYGKVKNLYRHLKDLLRNIYIYINDEFYWTSERICMAKIWKSEKHVWKPEGFIKKSEEFLWKNDEFLWNSERIYMAQRYSKYRFFDVNCILSILFQVQLWRRPGKPKFQFHILCVWSTFIYTYIYMYIICIHIYILIHIYIY